MNEPLGRGVSWTVVSQATVVDRKVKELCVGTFLWAIGLVRFGGQIITCLPSPNTYNMGTNRFEPSTIKNKIKREEIARKQKKSKNQAKLQRRLAQAKAEADDPLAKKVGLLPSIPYWILTFVV